jgi:hypothetical protein
MYDSHEARRAAVFSEDASVRWDVAADEHLPVELMRVLMDDPDPNVVSSLLDNYALPRELVAELRERRPDLQERVAMHVNAPLDLAEGLPLWKHTYLSIRSYAEARELRPDVLDRLLKAWKDAGRKQLPITLREAVDAAG